MSDSFESRDDFEDIRRLVSAETDEALRRFRAGNFEAKLRARIAAADRAAGEAPKRFFRLRPLAVSAVAAALILLLAGGAFLVLRHGRKGGDDAAVFVKGFGRLPGLESVMAGPAGVPDHGRTASASSGPMARVLGQAYEEKKAEEDRTVPVAAPAAPRLSLKKKIEILFKDRVLERVLSSIHEKSKEV
jgi:hypothetical protein